MAPSSLTDWITAVAAWFGVGGLFYAAKQANYAVEQAKAAVEQAKYSSEQAKSAAEQTKLLREQMKDDHDRSRRQWAVDIVWRFTEKINGTAAADFIEGIIDPNIVRKIFRCESVIVPINDRQLNALRVCLRGKPFELPTSPGSPLLPSEVVSEIQTAALSYLNVIESVLSGWQYGVADREIIEAQFQYLFDSTQGRNCLRLLRDAVGGDNIFPAISAFEHHLADRAHERLKGKPPLRADS